MKSFLVTRERKVSIFETFWVRASDEASAIEEVKLGIGLPVDTRMVDCHIDSQKRVPSLANINHCSEFSAKEASRYISAEVLALKASNRGEPRDF